MGGKIYLDVKPNGGTIKSRILPPPSASHVLIGAGMQGENVLKLAIVAEKEAIFDQRNYPHILNTKAKKVKNFFVYYSSGHQWEPLGFSGEEDIHLNTVDVFDCKKHDEGNKAPATKLDDHRLSMVTGMLNLTN